jgi:hypothetical protein
MVELAYDGYRSQGRRRRWADRQRWRLEDRLGSVLAEVERRAGLDEAADVAAEQAKVDRRHEWGEAIDAARARWTEDNYVRELDTQIAGWRRARDARAYAAAITQAATSGMTDELLRWVDWITAYADRVDPLLPLPEPPPPAEPRGDDLRPYLGRWSPHGPDRAY